MNGFIQASHVRRLERDGFVVLEGPDAVVRNGLLSSARAEIQTYFASGRFSKSVNGASVRQEWYRRPY